MIKKWGGLRSHLFTVLFCVGFFGACAQAQPSETVVKTGIEVLREQAFTALEGKRVGLITNATGVDRDLVSTIDILYRAPNVQLVALYGPEHGVRGDVYAGDEIETNIDEKTSLPVFSLYGKTKKPTPEMLNQVDVLVYDIQDIGSRSYTYISTLALAIEAAAEQGIELMVLDRPNPLGGEKVAGNIVEEGYFSFVSQLPIPYIHGLTVGELAQMINGEGWMDGEGKAHLTVIPMEGWNRSMRFGETGLPWVPTSPHIPHTYSAYVYGATGIMGELGVLSEGVGYTLPFQVMGSEWADAQEVATAMYRLGLPGVTFRPVTYRPYYGRNKGEVLEGVQIHITDYDVVNLMDIQFYFMQVHHQLYPEVDVFELAKDNRIRFFDLVTGTDQIRKRFQQRYLVDDIRFYLDKDIDEFKTRSNLYYLYR
ncbi:MAG: DUF1343 domain-containing protein [Bacteroidota bacterium]